VTLRCPECESRATRALTEEQVDALDDELERGARRLLADLDRITRENMAEAAARLGRALGLDAVLPEDF
jgi:hypothetical protein